MLLALGNVRAGDLGGACGAVMDLVAVLSAAGVRRSLIHAAAREGLAGRDGPVPALAAEVADRVLARLAGVSLLTFSVDGSAVSAHRLVMRVIRENLAAGGALTTVCRRLRGCSMGWLLRWRSAGMRTERSPGTWWSRSWPWMSPRPGARPAVTWTAS